MGDALRLYEQLTEAGEDKTRKKLIAEAFEQFEERYPNLKEIARHKAMCARANCALKINS